MRIFLDGHVLDDMNMFDHCLALLHGRKTSKTHGVFDRLKPPPWCFTTVFDGQKLQESKVARFSQL